MISPRDTCYVCQRDSNFTELRLAVMDCQARLSLQWRTTPVAFASDLLFPKQEKGILHDESSWYLLNGERTSIIPSLTSYKNMWAKAFFICPVDSNWMLFEAHDPKDVDFLVSIIEILQDQKDLWFNDEATCRFFMTNFIKYIKALKRLLMYVLHVAIIDPDSVNDSG